MKLEIREKKVNKTVNLVNKGKNTSRDKKKDF